MVPVERVPRLAERAAMSLGVRSAVVQKAAELRRPARRLGSTKPGVVAVLAAYLLLMTGLVVLAMLFGFLDEDRRVGCHRFAAALR